MTAIDYNDLRETVRAGTGQELIDLGPDVERVLAVRRNDGRLLTVTDDDGMPFQVGDIASWMVVLDGFSVRTYPSLAVYREGGDWDRIELVAPSLTSLSRVLRVQFGAARTIELTAEEAAYLSDLVDVDGGENSGGISIESLQDRLRSDQH